MFRKARLFPMEHNDPSCHQPSPTDHHLEYLDEFLQLRCAPDLIAMGLFPNAKEITESYAVWGAIRRFIFPQIKQHSSTSKSIDNRLNAIIVVGDGMTPRTAALCAYLTKGLWQCFSIDPALQYDTYTDMRFINRRGLTTIENCTDWKSINGLRIVRAKIQTISVQCRKAIVVMMHAHVTLEDAISSIDASEGIVGIVTCPCCNWASVQQEWRGQLPHHHYTDLRLLSSKNEMNVWCFPEGYDSKLPANSTVNITTEDKQPMERNIWGIDTSIIEHKLSSRDGVKERAINLWPYIFSQGIKAFNGTDFNEKNDFNTWPWGSTVWSPKDILPTMKSCYNELTSMFNTNNDLTIPPSWLGKPVLLIGTIAAMRRCKYTLFYELNPCTIPLESLEDVLKLTCDISIFKNNLTLENPNIPTDAFPALLKSSDRIWTCVEYQRHLQALLGYQGMIDRKTNKNDSTKPSNTDRLNVVLPLPKHQNNDNDNEQSKSSTQQDDHVNLFGYNPQPHPSLFPWAMYLRPSDILVAYCELICTSARRPQLRLIDGVLLFDSMLHMICADRRIVR